MDTPDPWSAARIEWMAAKRDADRFHADIWQNSSNRTVLARTMANLDDVEVSRRRALLELPAPNRAALRQKLDIIFSDIEEDILDLSVLPQTIADYRRILGDA